MPSYIARIHVLSYPWDKEDLRADWLDVPFVQTAEKQIDGPKLILFCTNTIIVQDIVNVLLGLKSIIYKLVEYCSSCYPKLTLEEQDLL